MNFLTRFGMFVFFAPFALIGLVVFGFGSAAAWMTTLQLMHEHPNITLTVLAIAATGAFFAIGNSGQV